MKNKIEAIQLTIALLRQQKIIYEDRNRMSIEKNIWTEEITLLQRKIDDLLTKAYKMCLEIE